MRQAEQRLRVIRQLLVWQFCGSLLAGSIGLYWGLAAAVGALVGGFIVWLPNCYFAYRAFRYRGARAAQQIVRAFYAGAVGKMLLSAALFTLVFVNLRPLNAAAVFLGYAFVQSVNWVVPLINNRFGATH